MKDKRLEFAVHFGDSPFKTNPIGGLGLMTGIGVALAAIVLAVALPAVASMSHDGMLMLPVAGLLKSVEMKNKAHDAYKAGKEILDATLKESRDPTDEERQAIDAHSADMDRYSADAKRWEKWENHEAGRTEAPEPPAPEAEDDDKPPKAEKPFKTLGHQLAAIFSATTHRGNVEESHNMLQAAAAGSNEKVDSEGGYLLQQDFAADLEKDMFQTGSLLSLMGQPIEVSSSLGLVEKYIDEKSRVDGSRWGGVRGYWVEEAEAATDSKPKFRKRHTELNKVAALGYSTDELLDDFTAMAGIFREAFRDELVFVTEDAIFEGDGSGKPLGMFNSANAGKIQISKEGGQSANTVLHANLSKMWARLHPRSKSRAVWAINTDVNPTLDEMTIPAGTGAVEPRFVSYNNQGMIQIKGRPVIELEYCATLGTAGDIVVFDPQAYRLIRKGGIMQASSIHVKFTTDEMTFKATYRIGGQPKVANALTPFKGSNTLSPYLDLATRS